MTSPIFIDNLYGFCPLITYLLAHEIALRYGIKKNSMKTNRLCFKFINDLVSFSANPVTNKLNNKSKLCHYVRLI